MHRGRVRVAYDRDDLYLRFACTLYTKKTIHQVTTIIKVSGHQYRWLAGGYDLEIEHF